MLTVLPLDLSRWDETRRDCLVLSVFKDERPLRGAAGAWAAEFELEIEPAAETFARDLVASAALKQAEIDELITTSSKDRKSHV